MKNSFFFLLLMVVIGCSNHAKDIHEGVLNTLFQLDENITFIGTIESFSMGDSLIVISNGDKMILFDTLGHQVSAIDKHGRGPFEYVSASIVRQSDDRLYVWDPYTMRFIVYDLNGEGISECKYDSAVFDFVPVGDTAYLYTAGKRDNHIIDIMNLSSGEVVDSLVATSKEHIALLMQATTGPIAIDGDNVYFMPKDSLVVYRYNAPEKSLERIIEFQSPTFSVKPFIGSVNEDVIKTAAYTFENSYTTGLAMFEGHLLILTSEGKAVMNAKDNLSISNSTLFSSCYFVDLDGPEITHIKYSEQFIGQWVSAFGGSLYTIKLETTDDNDRYYVCKLSR